VTFRVSRLSRCGLSSAPPLLFALALTACGGGGGGGGSVPGGPVPTPIPTATPTTAPTATPAGTATFTLTQDSTSSITGSLRKPRYVSPNTKSIAIVVNGAGSATILNLNDTSHCDASHKCSISLQAPPGNDTFVVSAYDEVNGGGNLLSRAIVQATIAPNGNSTVAAVLNGVVASVALTLATPFPTLHQTTTDALTVIAKDASGATIVGPGGYLYPITLANSDTSGHSSLTKTTLTGPGDTAALQYDGGYAAGTITASAQGLGTPATLTWYPTITSTETALPSGHAASKIVDGPDGALWFLSKPGSIGRITTAGSISEFAVPNWNPMVIASGPDAAIWIGAQSTTSANIALIRRNGDGSYTTYPAGTSSSIDALVTGPDGKLWFTGFGLLNSMTTSGTWTQFHIKDSNGNPVVVTTVALGPDGALWLGASGGLGRYDIASGTTTWYTAQPPGAPIPLTPSGIVGGPDSRLYFGSFSGIVVSDTSGSMSIVYQPKSGIASAPLDFAPDGGLWFSTGATQGGNASWGRIAGGSEIPIQGSSTLPASQGPAFPDALVTGPDQALWYTRGGVVGRMVP
jgi:streptogramin lyase